MTIPKLTALLAFIGTLHHHHGDIMHASNSSVIAKWSDAKDTMFINVRIYVNYVIR